MTFRSCFFATAAAVLALSPAAAQPAATTPPAGGSISIEAAPDSDAAPSRPVMDAVSEALATRGFTILEDPGHAAYVAELVLTRADVGTGTARPSAGKSNVAPGGAFGSVGAGVAIPLPTGKSELVPLRRTTLELRIRRRGDGAILWDGSAVTIRAAGTRTGTEGAVATALSDALLAGYPAAPAGVVGVP